jgi:hypothetical protein
MYTESRPRGNRAKLTKTKASIARLPMLVHAPAIDSVNPAVHESFVSATKSKKGRPMI